MDNTQVMFESDFFYRRLLTNAFKSSTAFNTPFKYLQSEKIPFSNSFVLSYFYTIFFLYRRNCTNSIELELKTSANYYLSLFQYFFVIYKPLQFSHILGKRYLKKISFILFEIL